MLVTQHYYSVAESISGARAKKKKRDEPSPFAQATFNAFQPFINVFDAGASCDGPYHTISKEDWEFYRRHKAGETPLFYEDGTQFNPFLHVVSHIYGPEHVQKHFTEYQTSYYTSGRKGLGLIYLDVDAHKPWQTDEAKGKDLLQSLFPSGYYRASNRGQNGYLKIRYSSIEDFNKIAYQLQTALQRLFLHSEILCDIEVKGTITHEGKSGLLAKLPFKTKLDQHKRDETDSWNGRQLELFKACPVVGIRRVEQIAQHIETGIDEDAVARFLERKKRLKEWSESRAEIVQHYRARGVCGTDEEVFNTVKALRDQRLQELAMEAKSTRTDVEPKEESNPSESEAPLRKLGSHVVAAQKMSGEVHGEASEGDAFIRNQQDLLPFVRDFYKKHRAFPTVEAALDHLQKNGLFSGQWSDNESGRAKRVGQILDFLAQDFNPKLLTSGEGEPVCLSLGKYGWWIRDYFGAELTVDVADLRRFDPITLTAPVQRVTVPAKFIETFLVVADFCLNQDPLDNKAVPTSRFKKLWGMVKEGAPWNQQYYQVVRERLDRMGVVRIFDRQHHEGKAWRWESGSTFPTGSWREQQRRVAEQAKRLRTGVSYQEFIANTRIVRNEELHNTLYQRDTSFQELWDTNQDIRPPPN